MCLILDFAIALVLLASQKGRTLLRVIILEIHQVLETRFYQTALEIDIIIKGHFLWH